jgi:MFS family permease
MVLSGIGVGLVFPQLSSVVAQALPPNRRGVGGAALQAGRQFGGTLGVALTIAFLGAATGLTEMMSAFDHIWWLIAIGGLTTSLLALPLRTTVAVAAHDPDDLEATPQARGADGLITSTD